VQVGQSQGHDLGRPAAGGVQGLEDGPVAEEEAVARSRGGQQRLDRLRRQDVRDALPERRRREQLHGRRVAALFQAEEAVEHFQRHQMAGGAGRGQPFGVQVADVPAQLAEGRLQVVA
jgi:hypothetical protein